MSLLPILAGLCPDCHEPLDQFIAEQPALFIHGGHGATERTRVQYCQLCGWTLRSEVTEVRPRRDTA